MRPVLIIAKMTILENSRKQVFHVLCLLMLAVIAASTLLTIYTEGVKLKILKDLCMTVISFGGAALSIALASGSLPNDIENRTIHPILARPITRAQYIAGKFLGTFATVAVGVIAMSLVFGALIYYYQHSVDMFLPTAVAYALIEVAVIIGFTTTISTFASPALTSMIAFLAYLMGSIKVGYLGGMLERSDSAFAKTVGGIMYHILPNLEVFNMKVPLVHVNAVPVEYMVQVAIYGVLYAGFALLIAYLMFAKREV